MNQLVPSPALQGSAQRWAAARLDHPGVTIPLDAVLVTPSPSIMPALIRRRLDAGRPLLARATVFVRGDRIFTQVSERCQQDLIFELAELPPLAIAAALETAR